MSKKDLQDPSKINYLDKIVFIYDKISKEVGKSALMKKKGSSGLKSWSQRYVCIFYNYFLNYNPSKEKSRAPTDPTEYAKGVVALETVTDPEKIEQYQEKGEKGYCFRIPTTTETFYFQVETEGELWDWIKTLKTIVKNLKGASARLSEDDMNKKLNDVKKIFPEKNFRPGRMLEESEKFAADMKMYKEEAKKWSGWVFSLALFAEYHIGKFKSYYDWYTNKSYGVDALIVQAEEDTLKKWSEEITKCPETLQNATLTMFFKEDLKNLIDRAQVVAKAVDSYNNYTKELGISTELKFQQEKGVILAWLEKLNSYPFSKEVTLESFKTGSIQSEKQGWIWDAEKKILKREKLASLDFTEEVEVEFSAKDNFQFIHQMYGIVLWNNRSCVWVHPKCPFVIRYDWFATKGVLKQSTINPPGAKAIAPALTDWQVVQNGQKAELRAVTVGQRDPLPEPPPETSFVLSSTLLPPPAILIPAIFYFIRPVCRKIYGLA